MKNLKEYLTESKTITKSNYTSFIDNDGMGDNLQDWYKKEYKTDDLGNELPSESFAEVLAAFFNNPKDFEEKYCLEDSIVRERIFRKLSTICNVKYDNFYDFWLKN